MSVARTETVDLSASAREAWADYRAAQEQAWAVYLAAEEPAWAAYQAAQETARAVLDERDGTLGAAASYREEVTEVVGMLPCALGVLDAHASDAGWCEEWDRLRDEALARGTLIVDPADSGGAA